MEPPSKRSRLSVSEATEDDEMTTEEFNVDDNITEEVFVVVMGSCDPVVAEN